VNVDSATTILSSAVRLSVPLAFAACGEYVAERAGTLNISVEAMMLGGAFAGAATASAAGSPAVGLFGGAAAGLAIGLVHANFSHRLSANTFVVGLTLNALVIGLTSFLIQSMHLNDELMNNSSIPLLSRIPLIGQPLFAQPWPCYLLYALIPATWWALLKTRWGLEVRAVGENPQAADVSGIPVNKRRRQTLMLCGLLSGVGGAYLVVAEVGSFNAGMTAGRGFIVIAAVIFGGWTLRGTILGCLLFGGADALRLALPALGVQLNSELLISAPYLLALLAMMFFAKRNRQPGALAQPFERGLT
jgi:general nucleoside transport system permease protein